MNTTKIEGSALIIAILFAMILGALALELLQKNSFESRITNYFNNKQVTLTTLERILLNKEQDLRQGKIPREASLISDRVCGVTFYSLNLKTTLGNSTSTLQTTFAKLGDTSKCDPKPIITEGRQAWIKIN